ncbi:MFS-type transporter SLC18B1 [Biomphalaria glabrata]|nr:MFS-type transporter SLC18B1 [Biomphalaria glabrata]
MSSSSHPYLSSSSFIFTKSGSYIKDVNTMGHRQSTGSLHRHSVAEVYSETIERGNLSNSREERRNSASKSMVSETNGSGNKISVGNGHTTLPDEIITEKAGEVMKFSQMPHRSKYTLFMLAVANFGAGCAYSLPAPFFPREAAKKGVSSTVIGLVFSCFQLVIVVTSPFFGNFITHIGAKFTYVSGIMTAGVCAILFGFLDQGPSGTPFIAMSFIVRTVEGIGVAAFSTASFAIVSNEFPNHIGSVFATLETCIGIGLMIGPTIGGALYEFGGFGMPFWVIGVIICSSGLTILTCLPQPQDTVKQKKGSIFSLLRSVIVWVSSLSIFAGACGISYLDPTLSDHLDQFGLSTLLVGLFFIIGPGLHAILAPVWGYISDRKDIQSPLLVLGNLVCTIGFLFVGPSPLLPFLPRELWVVTVGLILFGLTIGCSIVPTMKCLVLGARELGFPDNLSTFGMVSGLFNAAFCFGAFVGPTIGGALIEKIGFAYGSTIIASFFFVVMIVTSVYFSVRRLRHKSDIQMTKYTDLSSNSQQTLRPNEDTEITERSPLLLDKSQKKTRLTFDSSFSSSQGDLTRM